MSANGRSVVSRVVLRRARLSIQFSLRRPISFPKQRQRGEADQTSDLQVVTRHLDPLVQSAADAGHRRRENGLNRAATICKQDRGLDVAG